MSALPSDAGTGLTSDAAGDPLTGLRRELRLGWVVLAGLAVALGLWAALAPVSGAVLAHGTLRPTAQRVAVLSGSPGVVREWQLSEGRRVRAGEVLARLDDPDTLGQREALRDAEQAERLRVARLRQLASWAPGTPAPTLPAAEAGAPALRAEEQRLLGQSWAAQQAGVDQLDQQVREAGARVAALERATRADEAALQLAREELQRNERLVDDGFVSATRLLGLQRAVQDSASRLAAQQAALGEARDRWAELQGQRRSEPLRQVRDQVRELADAERRLAELTLRRQAAEERAERLLVRAPTDGLLVDVRPLAPGSVLAAGQALTDLVPAASGLRVQARVRPEDLAELRPGAHAEVRISAFPSRQVAPLAATVLMVGADRASEGATPGRPAPPEGFSVWLALAPTDLPLAAGMDADVTIPTRARTPLDYWLSPLGRLFDQSLRER